MTEPKPKARRRNSASNLPAVALSSAAAGVSSALASWRARIGEANTLLRLTLSLVQGPTSVTDEQREQLARLVAVEKRVSAQLPRLELSLLRSTTNARESGIDLRGPDAVAAEHYFDELRNRSQAALSAVADSLAERGAKLGEKIDVARRYLEGLGRIVDLIETMLYPRVNDPTIAIGDALERAAASRRQSVSVAGEATATVQQVRGLLRFLSEVISSVGDHAYVHIGRDGTLVVVSVSPLQTGVSDDEPPRERVELLRLAAYLIRVRAERVEGAWRLWFVGRAQPSQDSAG
jgi:hypothetical protein